MGELGEPASQGAAGGPLTAPAPLTAQHDLYHFDCGHADLDDWLRRRALKSDSRMARTYVVCSVADPGANEGARVVAYYCLAAGAVVRDSLPSASLRANAPDQVPVAVLGRLAVDCAWHGRGIGRGLLKDAILRTLNVSQEIGIRALLVHANDDKAAAFYSAHDFRPMPMDERVLVLPLETAARALG